MTENLTLDNGFDDTIAVTRGELKTIIEETEAILGEMKEVINIHAESLALHRFVLAKFVPDALFQAAVKQYYEARKKVIEMEGDAAEA